LFQNALFNDPAFLEFEETLLTTCREQDSPMEMKLKEVVPELEQVLTTLNMKMDTVTSLIASVNRTPINQCSNNSNELAAMNSTIRNIAQNFDQLKTACSYFVNSSAGTSRSTSVNITAESSLRSSNEVLNQLDDNTNTSTDNGEVQLVTAVITPEQPTPVVYEMKRWIKTVPDPWLEFTVGFEGSLSINELSRLYRASWRKDEKGKLPWSYVDNVYFFKKECSLFF
jgi:hypothetical protein